LCCLASLIPWVALSLGACSSPTQKADSLAQHFGFRKTIVGGDGFRHVLYENTKPAHDGVLHIYIDGDGTPYADFTSRAADPTPHNLLMFRLMARDPADSVYVGRPCYFALQHDSVCKPTFWTTARYGPQVLASMEAVLRAETMRHAAKRLEIFGLSGGGVIAVLLAQRIDAVARVVTIGSNLDIDAWCDLHHYSRLVGSINPVEQPPLRSNIDVLHLVGKLDTNTPPYLVQAAARQRGEQVRIVENFDHGCCWEKLWPTVLSDSP
jgi:hypothetical protein